MMPMDVQEFELFAADLRAYDKPWPSFKMTVLILASAMKWPHAVRASIVALSQCGEASRSQPAEVVTAVAAPAARRAK
jgi:hypothetical protein